MLTRPNKYLMNEADASPGNGAPASPAAPAEPQATPAAPLDVDALMTRLSGVIDEKLSAQRNGIFADLRKAGALKQDRPPNDPPPVQPTPSAPVAAHAGLSAVDVQAIIERDRVITARVAKHGLNEAQQKRFESAMASVSRESLVTEADSYLADMGLVKTATPPTPATPAPAAPAKPNISDRGGAAPTDTRDFEGVLNSRPLEMTAHDVDALVLKHGEEKGLQMFADRINAALRNVKLATPGGRQR